MTNPGDTVPVGPLKVADVDVLVEGDGRDSIVMVHGWPDTYRLWDAQVEALKSRYRCVRFTLPGFDIAKPLRPSSLQQVVDLIGAIADRTSPDRPVIVMAHDWGCLFAYEFVAQQPARVARLIGVDIGTPSKPSPAWKRCSRKARRGWWTPT